MDKTLIDLGCNKLQGYAKLKKMLGIDNNWLKLFVEANPENWPYLEQEVRKKPFAYLFKCAITGHGTDQEIITRKDRDGDIAATTQGKDFLDATLKKFDQHTEEYQIYHVGGITLAQLIEGMDATGDIFIKMDVEGAEYGIIDSFPWHLAPRIKKMWIEWHGDTNPEPYINKLKEAGIDVGEWE